MKNIIYILSIVGILIFSCGTPKNATATTDNLEYEIIIIDLGFNSYLATAKPMSYYTQSTLETKNRVYVTEWNFRASNPLRYNSNIYENIIGYQPNIDYGMEVNYKLYQYFQFAQKKYKMRLGSFRID